MNFLFNIQSMSQCLHLSLTHWSRVTHICVNRITIIGSDNGLSPGRWQGIILTNAGILLITLLGTNFSEILIKIDTFSLNKIHLKMSLGKWQPFCLGLNALICLMQYYAIYHCFKTLRPRQNVHQFPDNVFKYIFFNENIYIAINISLKFVPHGPIDNSPTLVQIMPRSRPGDKPLFESMMVSVLKYIWVIWPQWVKSNQSVLWRYED